MALLHLLLVFNILFLGISSMRITEGRNNETDRLALLDFKKQIDLDLYGTLSSWNDSIHFCNWVGITCGRRHLRVTGLDLRGKSLGGNLSPSIGNLTFLRVLNIWNNSFRGQIPQEIGNLIHLQTIVFENNTLGGEVPTTLANCTSLKRLYFSINNLVGKIPVELFMSLSKLEVISINANGLTGGLPTSFGNISSVQMISLASNKLQGSIPTSFGQLTNLESLSLFQNNLSGMVPLSLYNLSSLKMIFLTQNQLHESLPQDIGLTLQNLSILQIADNIFSGKIPNSITNISTIEKIELSGNSFVGPVPYNLGDLRSLQWFSINENQRATGEANDLDFVNSLINCTTLEILLLKSNGFKGPLPNFKANLSTQLSIFLLGGNEISGSIPTGFENLFNLIGLGMEYNFLEGNIPFVMGKLPRLQKLFLNGNRLSGQIPSSLSNLSLLYELHLDENNFSGSIPSSIGIFHELQYLTLSKNSLQGLIPKQLFLISSLPLYFDLSDNSLASSLPSEIGSLKSLSTFNISKNRLFGKIPLSIGDCSSMEYLYMGDNFFEGTIPQSLSLLKGLRVLDLSHNNLSGQIPKDLEELTTLQLLDLSFNSLEGEVPTRGIFRNASAIFLNGNLKLCGGVPELHLPACTNHGPMKPEKSSALRIILMTIGIVLGFLLISSSLILYWIRRSKTKPPSTPLIGEQFLNLSYKDLFQATEGFSSINCIGSGGFGYVYKGIIDQDETVVAIKVLNLQNLRAYKSFIAECKALRNIRHRNLIKILTSCSSLDSEGKDFKALVYEFMPNGSLDDWLHPSVEAVDHSRNLSLLQRLNIAIDVAMAMDYLHHNCYATIVHCDLKPSNVLLDRDMTAHVTDFGLARLLSNPEYSSSQTHTSTIGIKGSIGYVAPEYGMGGTATIQGDVYSYGILLLEMFTGKRPTDQMFIDELNLHNFAKTALPLHVMQILDPTFLPREDQSGEIVEVATNRSDSHNHRTDQFQECIVTIFEIAIRCSMESPRERMDMNDVVNGLVLLDKNFLDRKIS